MCLVYMLYNLLKFNFLRIEPLFQYKSIANKIRELITIKKQINFVSVSWLDSTFCNTCNFSMHMILHGRKKRKKKKIFSSQFFRTRATLGNILKSLCAQLNSLLTQVKLKSKLGFKTLKISFLFNTQNHKVCKSQEFPQIK